ncbi:MAG: TPM domain-containing protein [Clostridia bacterium]|nr:TPM domain-containing protein [Clostridia bacterium]
MKRWLCALAALLWMLWGCSALAERTPIIRDDADLLSASEEEALREAMLPVCEYGTPVFWTTTQSGNYWTKAKNLYYRLLGNDSGALFVIDMNERKLALLTDGAVRRVISDGDANSIVDNVFRFARGGDYAACANEVFRQTWRLLNGEQIARPMKLVSNILLALVLALLVVYYYIRLRYESHPENRKGGAVLPVTAGAAAAFTAVMTGERAIMTKQRRVNISSSSSGGGGRSGGGFSGGGGGGGGGFSGGGGSHSF